MRRHRYHLTIGLLAGLLLTGSAQAEPAVVPLGTAESTDPVTACGDLAASPYETGRDGRGVTDEQIFIDDAITTCEAALAADPQSDAVQTWLARAYYLAGRSKDAETLLSSASDAGNAYAAYLLRKMLSTDLDSNVASDPDRAADLLQQASDGGVAPAQSDYAERLETAGGVPGNYEKAQDLYQLASDQGFGYATYKLGYFAQAGYIAVDYAKAMDFFQRAAEQGEPLGDNGAGQLYEFGQGVDQDYAKAAEFYQLGADKREKQSETALAYFYEQGTGVTQDYDKSFALLVDASAQDWGYAHAALAIHYLFGEGTSVDEPKAFDLAWRAQRLGIVYAEGILGYMYQNGFGTPRDLSQALFHFNDGSKGGDQYSTDQIPTVNAEIACEDEAGSPYEPGGIGQGKAFLDIDADSAIAACENAANLNSTPVGNRVWLARAYARAERYQDAVPLLEEGVTAGNLLAQTVLADLLLAGNGIDRDPKRAISLYETAAKDFGLAQLTLGQLYAEGLEVPKDRDKALEYLRMADISGVTEAAAEIDTLLNSEADTQSIDLTGFGREGPAY